MNERLDSIAMGVERAGLIINSPSLINIVVYNNEDNERIRSAIDSITKAYPSSEIKSDNTEISISSNGISSTIEMILEKDCSVLLIRTNHQQYESITGNWHECIELYRHRTQTYP